MKEKFVAFPDQEVCPHGNIPAGCAECKLSPEEAQDEANMLRLLTAQGAAGLAYMRKENWTDRGTVVYNRSSSHYTNQEKAMDQYKEAARDLRERHPLTVPLYKALNEMGMLLGDMDVEGMKKYYAEKYNDLVAATNRLAMELAARDREQEEKSTE